MPQILDAMAPKLEGVVLAIYAPFGSDETLSTYGNAQSLLAHPLVAAMRRVAKAGTHVVALIDRFGDNTWLLDIPVSNPDTEVLENRWKQDMRSARTLTGFLLEVHQRYPLDAIVLGLEGHGAGYLPELDTRRLTWNAVNHGTEWVWHISGQDAAPFVAPETLDAGGFPALGGGFPSTPGGNPAIPVNHQPMSTYSLGRALQDAQDQGCPRLSVIHFDNCFNMSTELLHTVAPYADAADGFCNYGFFTAGEAYAKAFEKLGPAGAVSALDLAKTLSLATYEILKPTGGFPAVGGAVELSRMKEIAYGIDQLADKLIDILRGQTGLVREKAIGMIKQSIIDAQNYDTDYPLVLETPDQLTDIDSLANALVTNAVDYPDVRNAAAVLVKLLNDIKTFGDVGIPAMDPTHSIWWNFSEPTLAMNIFLPDPLRIGQFDWRSPYYADVNPQPFKIKNTFGAEEVLPPAQTGVITFLAETNWVEFLKEYHLETQFLSFHVGKIPNVPPYDPKYVPPTGKGGGQGGGCTDTDPSRPPRKPWPLGPVGRVVSGVLAGLTKSA